MSQIPADYLALFAPILSTAPVNVAECAARVGLPIYSIDLPDRVSGMLVRGDERAGSSGFTCYVDKSEPSVRQRFSAAHELGHFALHQHLIGETHMDNYLLRSEGMSNGQEAAANRFAADILMPRDLISEHIANGTASVADLAALFHVSQIAMGIRLGLPT